MIPVPPPHPSDLGRFNVAATADPPVITHCRWCLDELVIRRHVVHCPECDRIPPRAAAR